jgi:DNA-binding MarR family transcriptional regulator
VTLSPIERETLALLPMTRQALAALLDITMSAACQRVQSLATRGLVTGDRGPVACTAAGDEALREAPSPSVALALPDEALPPRAVVSGAALRVLRYLVDESSAGRRTTQKSMAVDLRAPRSSITTLVRSLMAGGFVEADASLSTRHRRNVPTPLGIAVVDGRVPVVSRQLVQAEARLGRRIETLPAARAARPRRTAKPRRSAEDVRAAVERVQVRPAPATVAPREPVDVGPPVPPGFNPNAPRPIRHPAPPAPGQRDPRQFTAGYWHRLTTAPHSPLHEACARGTA